MHYQQHSLWMQQQMQQLVAPAQLPQVAQLAQQHLAQHQQILEQQGKALGGRAGASPSGAEGPTSIQGAVQSNAATLAAGVKAETEQARG